MVTIAELRTTGQRVGVLTHISVDIYWMMMLSVFFVLACIPGVGVAFVMEPGRPSLLLIALALIPIGPALAASMFAWQERRVAEDPAPLRSLLRGYRLSALDALKVWLVCLAAMTVVVAGIMAVDAGSAFPLYRLGLAAVGVVVLVGAMHALSVATFLKFRLRDVIRLAVMHTVRLPGVSLAVTALLLCMGAVLYMAGDGVGLLTGAVFARLLRRYESPLVAKVRADFTAPQPPPPLDH